MRIIVVCKRHYFSGRLREASSRERAEFVSCGGEKREAVNAELFG
jgi:hypothetical protein